MGKVKTANKNNIFVKVYGHFPYICMFAVFKFLFEKFKSPA